MMYDVITVGSATFDVFANTNFSEIVKILEPNHESDLLAYPIGAKILINELNFSTGGGGTNTAVCFAKLGHKVAWLGKLGNDENADYIINGLKKDHVDIMAKKGKGLSGYSIILDSIEHDRTILTYKGENDNLGYEDVPINKLNTKWFYFSSMMDKSYKTLERLSNLAKKKDIKIAFNASEYLAKKGFGFLKNILKNTTVFILNKEEAQFLTKGTDVYKMLIKIASFGPSIVGITDGKNGSYIYDGHYLYKAAAHNIKVVETTGAGDAFAATFISGLIKKNDVEFAIQLAVTNAESVIKYHGAKNKLLKYAEALKILKNYPVKIKKQRIS